MLTFGSRFIEEPTAPDDILGHAAIRKALKPYGIGVATGEHAHNRMVFKQLLQAEAIDVCQIDSCRLAGVSEVLSVLLMAAKFGVPVCTHAGGVGLCEYVIHLSLIDYIAVSGSMERNVLEFVDHLHEHFLYPCSINKRGRYNVPSNPAEGYRCAHLLSLFCVEADEISVALRCTRTALHALSGRMGRTGSTSMPQQKPTVLLGTRLESLAM